MKKSDIKIISEVRSYLGLDNHDYSKVNRLDLGGQHMQSMISELFKLKTIDLSFHDSVVTAFNKTQHHMYLDDPAFHISFKKEMTGRGIPKNEIEKALSICDKVLDQVAKEFDSTSSKDAGVNPNMKDIVEVSKPEQPTELEILKPRKGHSQAQNIESDMPIDRPKPKRINESYNGYETTIELESPEEFVQAKIDINYDIEPAEKQTYDHPGYEGDIIINGFKIDKIETFKPDTTDWIPQQPKHDIKFYHNLIQSELKDKMHYYKELISIQLKDDEDTFKSEKFYNSRKI